MNYTFNFAFLKYPSIFAYSNFAGQFGPFPVPSKLKAAADGIAAQPLIEVAHFRCNYQELPRCGRWTVGPQQL